jgi:NAD+ synthase (glutamine-hydrolysing)
MGYTGGRLGPGAGAYARGFARVAACTFPISVADPAANADRLLEQARRCHEQSVSVAVFTELCLSGYAIDDLFLQDAVLDAVDEQLGRIADASCELLPVLAVGAPLRHGWLRAPAQDYG